MGINTMAEIPELEMSRSLILSVQAVSNGLKLPVNLLVGNVFSPVEYCNQIPGVPV